MTNTTKEDLKLKEIKEFLVVVDKYKKTLENYDLAGLEELEKKLQILESMRWSLNKPIHRVLGGVGLDEDDELPIPIPEPAISKVDRIVANLINPNSIRRLAEGLTGVADNLDKKKEPKQ